MNIEETYGWQWSSDPTLLKSLLDAYVTVFARLDPGSGVERSVMLFINGARNEHVEIQEFGSHTIVPIGTLLDMDIEFLDPRPRGLEPSPLEWSQDIDNSKCESAISGYVWRFYAHIRGWAHVYFKEHLVFIKKTDSMETAKAAIHEWRVNHLKSIIGGK